ncbi:MAG: hypothetical protein ACE5HV_17185 [Acidobacteriota bacterium]
MVHGLTKDGPDDHRIPTFASTCARGGMAVAVPEFPDMRARRMKVDDSEDVLRAALALPKIMEVEKVVLLAFSYAAGPTFQAAAKLSSEQLAGTVTVGAYYDVDHLMEFTATGKVAAYGKHQPTIRPDPVKRLEGQWVFLSSAADWLTDSEDQRAIADASSEWKKGAPPSWEQLRPSLTAEGRALLDAVTVNDPEQHATIRDQLPAGVARAMAMLTLRGKLETLSTPVVLIHGRHDVRIPFRESILLRNDLRNHTEVKLAILNAFVHAQRAVGWSRPWTVAGDAAKLGRCGLDILRWAV